MDVYHAPPEDAAAGTVTVRGEEAHHLLRVARHGAGDEVLIADGAGMMYRATVGASTGGSARDAAVACAITARLPEHGEPAHPMVLAAAMLRNPGRMDWLIEKAVELGVTAILPMITERTVARAGKSERWRHLALAAMKQCGRCRTPAISAPVPLADAPARLAGHELLVFHEAADAGDTPEAFPPAPGAPVAVFVGPEGGFADPELRFLRDAGARVLSLGGRRLRAETAALAALARLHA